MIRGPASACPTETAAEEERERLESFNSETPLAPKKARRTIAHPLSRPSTRRPRTLPSSRRPRHSPLKAGTRVRIPLGAPYFRGFVRQPYGNAVSAKHP